MSNTMSDQDPFAQTPGAPADDPFAASVTTDPADEIASEPTADQPEADLPTVDREGEPVPATDDPEADAIEAAAATPEQPEGEAAVVEQPPAPAEAQEEPEQAVETPDPEQPVEAAQEPPQAAEQEPEEPQGDEEPQANGPRGGKGEFRRYKLLYQTAERTWTEFDLGTVDQEKTGAKIVLEESEHWLLARNNEHANRVAFSILGRPASGVTAFPVPRGSWKPKRIKPAPPRPERERLEIS